MKKVLFFLVSMLTFVVISEAQNTTLYGRADQTYFEYTTDVTLTNSTAQYLIFDINAPSCGYVDYIVHLDSLAGNHTNVAVALSGRKSDQTSTWTAIGSTINWKGTTADTTIIMGTSTTNVCYKQIKATITGTGTGTTTIANEELKYYYAPPE